MTVLLLDFANATRFTCHHVDACPDAPHNAGNMVELGSHGSLEWYLAQYDPKAKGGATRHDRTSNAVRRTIADLVGKHGPGTKDFLEIGGYTGWQTVMYRDRLKSPRRTVIYDWQDYRTAEARKTVEFHKVNLEVDRFPDGDASFDVIVCNQVFEHLKNIYLPLSEICRILRPGGHLIISVPNISALHNCLLFCLGRQPSTMGIMDAHVRGFAIWSFSEFLQFNGHFRIRDLKGLGLHPFTSAGLPGFLRTYCHTPVWALQKMESSLPLWEQVIRERFMTTNFF